MSIHRGECNEWSAEGAEKACHISSYRNQFFLKDNAMYLILLLLFFTYRVRGSKV